MPHTLSWREAIQSHPSGHSHVAMLNTAIVQYAVYVHNDCTRVEVRLHTAAQKVQSELKRCCRGRMRQFLLGGEHHLFVLQEEAGFGRAFRGEGTEQCRGGRWKIVVQEKESAIDDLLVDMASEMAILMEVAEARESELSAIKEASGYTNHGKPIEDVRERQARRKMSEVASLAKKALWFAETFSLIPESLGLRKAVSGEVISVRLSEPATSTPQCNQPADRERIAQILYLLDRFAISDEAYHELASITDDLPPSYKVKRKRYELNDAVEVTRLTGSVPGAYRPFKELLHSRLSQAVSVHMQYRVYYIDAHASTHTMSCLQYRWEQAYPLIRSG